MTAIRRDDATRDGRGSKTTLITSEKSRSSERAEDVIFQRDRIIKVSLAEEIEEECRVPNVDTAEWSFWQVFGLLAPASVWYAVVEPRGVDVQDRAVSTPTDPVRIENAISLPY